MKWRKEILSLSEKMKWRNWPTWLKGLFISWPSLGPAYLFLTRPPFPTGGNNEIDAIMTNIEYQNYIIAVFIGLWSINLLALGITWFLVSIVSKSYRFHLNKTESGDEKDSIPTEERLKKTLKKKNRPGKGKKGGTEDKEYRNGYPVLKKKDSSSDSDK